MSLVPDVISTKNGPAHPAPGDQGGKFEENSLVAGDSRASWQRELAAAVRSRAVLLRRLGLDGAPAALRDSAADPGDAGFPVLVPESFLRRMKSGDPCDPLLLQVLPTVAESRSVAGFVTDAVGDQSARTAPGLLQKYAGRALLIASGSCAVHCRYCFRRQYPYHADPRGLGEWEPALRQIADDTSLTEVIFSGGDPLMLTDLRLEVLVDRIDRIPHVERIRVHTRLPIVLPSRVTDGLLQIFRTLRSQAVFVVHANHANEIDTECGDALRRLVQSGIPVLNQSVLLRGVNDSVEALEELSRRLIRLGVMPYYLHQLDRVAGTAHFEVAPEQGRMLVDQLTKRLPGYAVPRYVREIPGETSKIRLDAGS